MKKYFKTIATAMVAFAFLFSAFAAPIAIAIAQTTDSTVEAVTTVEAVATAEAVATVEAVTTVETVTTSESIAKSESVSSKECKLEVNKVVNKSTANPGEKLTYTITIKNVGTADCTGDGVKIKDVVDSNLEYISHDITSNLSAGYGSNPVYTSSDRTLHFNGNTLEPGEAGTITMVGKVNTPAQCGDFVVKNQAKATAKELNNFKDWVYSQGAKTTITNSCNEPTPPKCPIAAAPNRTIVDFTGDRLRSNKTVDQSQTLVKAINVAPGQYDITLVSWDGYNDRVNASQPNEQYKLQFMNGSSVLATSNAIGDLADNVREATKTEKVNSGFVLATAATGLRAVHAVYPDKSSANSLNPICAALDKKVDDEPTPPKCPLSPAPGRTIVDFTGDKLKSNKTIDLAQTAVKPINIPAGQYDITLVSWDGYNKRVNVSQLNEQYQLQFMNGSSVLASSGIISDLADNVREATNIEKVNTGFTLANAANGLRAVHAFYPDKTSANSHNPICAAIDEKPVELVPSCDMFKATPNSIKVGEKATLTWETSNAVQVLIDNAIGSVDPDGSIEVSPLANTIYKLTVIGANNKTVSCEAPVTVTEDSVPVCEFFTATPGTLPVGGGNVTLDWAVLNATGVTIAPTVGVVGLVGTSSVNVTESTTFTLTAVDADGDKVTCPAPVVVPDPVPLTCANNVTFSASDTSITRGQEITLNWSTTNVDSVSISVIGATALSGNEKVSPSSDTTYVLTATQGSETIECPISVKVTTGGGGGGSPSPRCDLKISDTKIKLGDQITLTWDTSNATEVTLTDDRGKVIFTTDDYLAADKKDYYDGSIKLKPTRDTKYTLLAERGSRDEECKVAVNMDSIVVLQTRDQQPLVAGISLSQVPYTGFEAGPFMTIMFYALLVAWALYITYILVIRNKMTSTTNMVAEIVASTPNQSAMKHAETVRPDAFVASVTATAPTAVIAPTNLPTGNAVVGYENQVEEEVVNPHQVNDKVVTQLENRAHSQHALLSSDAVRHFVGTTTNEEERNKALDAVIAEAKKNYPLEDGWIVINELRMKNLCETCQENSKAATGTSFIPATVPEGTGSLAEAIVTGNIVAAYEMIGNRPMFALADASADLDAVYRSRRGGKVQVSDMLLAETKELSDEKIKNMITALTGALDGVYTDEASAVKMAIMKAVKEVA